MKAQIVQTIVFAEQTDFYRKKLIYEDVLLRLSHFYSFQQNKILLD